ncbi:MAG: cyclic pyranopterin monophosphate synthase MoaC [Lentisphaeria bacterium]|jgi:cyclic pyranopterin phosphate synthase|nr:cyclic pyranopterin monophosphate synthase MoaC [Lentisphaeria bacterium]
MTEFTHVDAHNQPTMVDVGDKTATERRAHARTIVQLPPEVLEKLVDGDIQSAKGPVFQTAIIAGTMAVKKTSELIPFCHPLPIEQCKITIAADEQQRIVIDCTVRVHHKTGVEMEALTGASVAALAIYDMCKGLSHDIVIESTQLIEKTGGKRDFKRQSR